MVPNHHKTPSQDFSLLSLAIFRATWEPALLYPQRLTALSTKTHGTSRKPFTSSCCRCSIISLDIQMKFCVEGPFCLCEVISALCDIFLFLGTNNVTRLKMHSFKMGFHSEPLQCQRIQVCSACMSNRVSQGQVPLLSTIMNIKLVFISFSTWKIL